MFVGSGVIFAWDLIFCLFKHIASNEKGKRFLYQASLWFPVLFPQEKKILFEL